MTERELVQRLFKKLYPRLSLSEFDSVLKRCSVDKLHDLIKALQTLIDIFEDPQ